MKNNNPIDDLIFASASTQTRFSAAKFIWGSATLLFVLIATVFIVHTEFFTHYFIHFPAALANGNWKKIATTNHTNVNCSRCNVVKQRVISMLTPEEREMIKVIDQANVIKAKRSVNSNAAYQRELKKYIENRDNEKWNNYLKDEYTKALKVLENNK